MKVDKNKLLRSLHSKWNLLWFNFPLIIHDCNDELQRFLQSVCIARPPFVPIVWALRLIQNTSFHGVSADKQKLRQHKNLKLAKHNPPFDFCFAWSQSLLLHNHIKWKHRYRQFPTPELPPFCKRTICKVPASSCQDISRLWISLQLTVKCIQQENLPLKTPMDC